MYACTLILAVWVEYIVERLLWLILIFLDSTRCTWRRDKDKCSWHVVLCTMYWLSTLCTTSNTPFLGFVWNKLRIFFVYFLVMNLFNIFSKLWFINMYCKYKNKLCKIYLCTICTICTKNNLNFQKNVSN